MVAAVSPDDGIHAFCPHCERNIPISNFDLHFAHCKRNLERCKICKEMVPKVHADEHYQDVHAPIACPLCGDTVERETFPLHERDKCPQRLLSCSYCEFPVPAEELDAHMDGCGNRTEFCVPCGKYVRLQERIVHDLQYHVENQEETGSSSRNVVSRPQNQSAASLRPGQARAASSHRLFVTCAVTGIAILIGALVFQSRPDQ